MKKEKSMIEYQKNKKSATRERVEKELAKLKRRKTSTTKSEFCKAAGITLQYLYKYPDLNDEVNKYCKPTSAKKKKNQTSETKDTIIITLRAEIRTLKKQIQEQEKDEKYKEKYESAQREIKKLKMQLETAYASVLDSNF